MLAIVGGTGLCEGPGIAVTQRAGGWRCCAPEARDTAAALQ